MWSKLDHGFFRNPKTLTVGQDARLLYLAGVCYAGDRLTDGFIPDDSLPIVAAEAQVSDSVTAVARLVAAGLWHVVTGGHRIHDFFDFNPNAKQTKARREATRTRVAAYRARKKAVALNGSDGDIGNAVTQTSQARVSQRTNVVKDSDSDSELRVPAPLPPTPPPPDPEAREQSPRALRAIPKPHEVERAELEANPLYDPLVTLFGKPIARELDAWREDIADLDDMQALPEDVPRAAAAYSAIMGADATGRPILLTRAALVRHWFRCIDAASYPDTVPEEHDPYEAGATAWARRHGLLPEAVHAAGGP